MYRNKKLSEAIIKGGISSKLAVFDLDDTLIVSSAKIQVLDIKTGKVIKSLTPAEFNYFKPSKKHSLSFVEFEDIEILKKASFIIHVLEKLQRFYHSGIHVSIVTARSDSKMIREFFLINGIDIHPDLVIAVNDPKLGFKGSVAERKKEAIHRLVEEGYSEFVFFDDNEENLALAKEVEKEKNVKVETIKV
jgi:FMN phosphatase YigB (HAD superfamily)